MKYLKEVLLALLFFISISTIKAQDANKPWELDFGVNAVIFYPMASINNPGFNDYAEGLFNVGKHYNYYGVPVKLHIGRYIAKGFSIGMSMSTNKIRKMGSLTGELNYFGLDTDLRLNLTGVTGAVNIVKNLEIDPYILTGVGYTSVGSRHNGSLNFGGGINFWVNKKKDIGIQVQTVVKKRLDGTISSYYQHSLGVAFKFGGKDTDKDGINDNKDKCPEVAGLESFNGCPDTDGDGITDSDDVCPEEYGTKEMSGCPDADADGIADKDDACPNVAGARVNNGCPDSDSDGVLDKNDACINIAGPMANKGCPWPDSDRDGVLDKDDRCVNTAGPVSNYGCPKEDYLNNPKLKNYAMVIHFVNNHSTFNSGITSKLDAIVSVMKNFEKTKFSIYGYTDSRGSEKYNLWLSRKRAYAAKNYLVKHGISANRIITKGFGESNPISSNNTALGRADNRRVEIKIINK